MNPVPQHRALLGVDVIVPLELDLDGDPLQDDEVRLRSRDGEYERVLWISDRNVTRDEPNRLAHYRFRRVPFGYYDVAARIGGRWVTIFRKVLVMLSGVYGLDQQLTEDPPKPALPAEPAPDGQTEPPPGRRHYWE